MRKSLVLAAILALGASSLLAETQLGLGAALTLPQGGSDFRRTGGAALRVGQALSYDWMIEGGVAWQENLASLEAMALCHWTACELYDRFFGFSAFDPFFSFGAKGWVGSSHGQVGPAAGIGAFYHVNDRLSLRADATAVLGLDSERAMSYSFFAGLVYSFGEIEE